jgi:hypothetical protein
MTIKSATNPTRATARPPGPESAYTEDTAPEISADLATRVPAARLRRPG